MRRKEEAQRVVVVEERKETEVGHGHGVTSVFALHIFYHVIGLCNQPPSRITGKPIVASKNPTSIMHHRSQWSHMSKRVNPSWKQVTDDTSFPFSFLCLYPSVITFAIVTPGLVYPL